jgi:hypothetical protein
MAASSIVAEDRVQPTTTREKLLKQATDRNRVNQRNFRARRQAYTKELEARLHKLESDGLHAAKLIQQVAQRVDNENRLLRELLHTRFNVEEKEIDDYLGGCMSAREIRAQSKNIATSELRAGQPRTDPQLHMPGPQVSAVKINDDNRDISWESPVVSQATTYTNDLIPATCFQAPMSLSSQVTPQTRDNSHITINKPIQVQSAAVNFNAHVCLPRPSQAPYDDPPEHCTTEALPASRTGETSCLEAATIIASMRGGAIDERVWLELGCQSKQDCSVQNTAVFELMDQP